MLNGVRYRETFKTSDEKEAKRRTKERIAELVKGHRTSNSGREFARKALREEAELYFRERKPQGCRAHASNRSERLRPIIRYFGKKQLSNFKADDISAYQIERLSTGYPTER